MRKIKLIAVFLLCFLLASCGGNSTTADKPQTYVHNYSGMSFHLPAGYEKQTEDNDGVSFLADEGKVAIQAFWELGGNDYYSLPQVSATILEFLQENMPDYEFTVMGEGEFKPVSGSYKTMYVGKDKDGKEFIAEFFFLNPHPGVRYYMYLVTDYDTYSECEAEFNSIFASFTLTKTQEDIYKLIKK